LGARLTAAFLAECFAPLQIGLIWGGVALGYVFFMLLLWRFGEEWGGVFGAIKLVVSFAQVGSLYSL
jgi:hypothetical protein